MLELIKETFRLKLRFAVFFLCGYIPTIVAAGDKPALVFCYGQMMSDQWDARNRDFIHDIFSNAGMDIRFQIVPNARGKRLFNAGICHIHSGGFRNYEFLANGSQRIEESVYDLDLAIYQNNEIPKISNEDFDLQSLDRSHVITGFPRSSELAALFLNFRLGKAVSVEDLAHGSLMLKHNRIQFLLAPEIHKPFAENYLRNQEHLIKVGSFISMKLYWWINKAYSHHKSAISSSIKRAKKKHNKSFTRD